jgi:hypothetical protein
MFSFTTREKTMKQVTGFLIFTLALAFAACQSAGTSQPNNGTASPNQAGKTVPSAEPGVSEAKPPVFSTTSAPDTGEAVKFPFPDFPRVDVAAKAGDYVLAPSYNWIKDVAEKGVETTSFIWYVQKMAVPGQENSELQFLQERHKVPNAYIISIPPKQTARKGDIVLTWWQTGSGMQRAIVVDDADPSRPIVRYLDIAYDNPAKSRDGSTTIGKMDERLVPDSFVKLKSGDPGTRVAVQVGANQKAAAIIRNAGASVLVLEAGNKLAVHPKSNCLTVPLIPKATAGDRVKAPRYGQNFASATVTSIDERNGRVFVRFDGDKEDKAIAFGDILN